MAGIAALRAGAGLVTVASAESALPAIAGHAPEIMTEPLAETEAGTIRDAGRLGEIAATKDILAIGPGLGRHPETQEMVAALLRDLPHPMVIDADALTAEIHGAADRLRVLTPHPGEMARLTGKKTAEIQAARVDAARDFATGRKVCLVLKGQRTLIAFPDGRVWINPTGSPAMATGGSGDILTGMIAGFLGQFTGDADNAIAAAVYLHGRAGQLAAATLGDKPVIATDLLRYLPAALEECAGIPDRL